MTELPSLLCIDNSTKTLKNQSFLKEILKNIPKMSLICTRNGILFVSSVWNKRCIAENVVGIPNKYICIKC